MIVAVGSKDAIFVGAVYAVELFNGKVIGNVVHALQELVGLFKGNGIVGCYGTGGTLGGFGFFDNRVPILTEF